MHIHNGGCLCGSVRYEAKGPLRDVTFCHCSQCRRQTGLYYATTAVDLSEFRFLSETGLAWYAASTFAKRGFCSLCGSVLFWKPERGNYIAILAGSLDDPSVLRAYSHICTEGRATFYALCDGLPQYAHDAPNIPIAGPEG